MPSSADPADPAAEEVAFSLLPPDVSLRILIRFNGNGIRIKERSRYAANIL